MDLKGVNTEIAYTQALVKILNIFSVGGLVLNLWVNPVALDFFGKNLVGFLALMVGTYCLFLSRSQQMLEVQWPKHFFITLLPMYLWWLVPILAYANEVLKQAVVTSY